MASHHATLVNVPRAILLGAIRVYQLAISPMWGPRCRFYPSCSCYAHEAIARHGALRGVLLAVYRILRCQPLSPGGYDPVPDERSPDA